MLIRLFSFLFTACLSASLSLSATQLMPWFGIDKELELRTSYRLQQYDRINSSLGSISHHAIDNYIDFSLAISPSPAYNAELELLTARPNHNNYRVDGEKATLRCLLADDVSGAFPVSIDLGFAFTHVHRPALHYVSNIYHGRFQYEGILSLGKELDCGEFWANRFWGALIVGGAEKYSPWLKAILSWEKNWWNVHEIDLHANLDIGFGHRALNLAVPFHGYGPIKYRILDLCADYRYWITDSAQFTLEYCYRVYAHNAPARVSNVTLTLFFPIDL